MTPTMPETGNGFEARHIGPREDDIQAMLARLGCENLDEFIEEAMPNSVRSSGELNIGEPRSEAEALAELRELARGNRVLRSLIGMGYHGTLTPSVIARNVLENPGWYTQYTPYQAEIAQGRLELLFHFQTLISDLTGLPIANASLLDEGTAAAEAMYLAWGAARGKRQRFHVTGDCHPQTLAVIQTRAEALGIEVVIGPGEATLDESYFGALWQNPSTDGVVRDLTAQIELAHSAGAMAIVATDPLAMVLMQSPGSMGADVAIGSTQRLGVPMGYGGPHAAFMAVGEEHKRKIPGRIVGQSRDANGKPAYRLALQTREQHIRREKATSNICTSQVLLAIVAVLYAIYHGPEGLARIARAIHRRTRLLARGLEAIGIRRVSETPFFDSLHLATTLEEQSEYLVKAEQAGFNLRAYDDGTLGINLDETINDEDLRHLLGIFAGNDRTLPALEMLESSMPTGLPESFERRDAILHHEAFSSYRSEHELTRYLKRLEQRDLSLTTSMIPLGSCTMKLNPTSAMLPISWPEFKDLHPFAPTAQTKGYRELFKQLESWLCSVTGFAACSLQPNAGSQGEYTGLLTIRAWHHSRGDAHRDICLIPGSAHGTNPASATVAGFKVVAVKNNEKGDIDLEDLEAKATANADALGAIMITYPSTQGVFEKTARRVCEIVHAHGGLVYLDGANMNAQVGLCTPGGLDADVCHLNLHKTFAIPHGGGGPGVGPICVNARLAPFLPGHPLVKCGGEQAGGPVSAAPWGSASILPISWMYIRMMGSAGLRRASQVAVLNANYMISRLEEAYHIFYRGKNGRVAHEFIIDLRPFKKSAAIEPDDVAKRLMDYGFHAPTMSWPIPGTLMVEPTESESRAELDRFCEAMLAIREEIRAIEEGRADREDNPLKHAPHTAELVTADTWDRAYTRSEAAWPAPWLREHKYWPPVARVDNAWGDRNLLCTCGAVEDYTE